MASEKPELTYSDDEGQKALVCGELTFYFNRIDDRAGLVRALEIAMNALGEHALWCRTETMSRSRKMSPELRSSFAAWFQPGAKLRREYELTLTSDPDKDLTRAWGLRLGVEPPLLPDDAGFLQLNFPLESSPEGAQALRSLAFELADHIDFRSGHAGFGVQYDEGDLDDERDEVIGDWCRRYQCVDYRDFAASCEFMGNSIKGVGWLTFLDDAFAKQLGGEKQILQRIGGEVQLVRLKRGFVLQAGALPLLGDRKSKEDVEPYREAFAVVAPIVVQDDLNLPGFGDEESVDWARRFGSAP